MPRAPTLSVPIRKIRPRPSGFVHRVKSALARAAEALCVRLWTWMTDAATVALAASRRFRDADEERAWDEELCEELVSAYEKLVREPSPFLDAHRRKWMKMTTTGDVHVYESFDEMQDDDTKGGVHVVGNEVDRDPIF